MDRRRIARAFFPVAGLAALLVVMDSRPAMADRHTGDAGGGGGRGGRSNLKGVVITGDWVPGAWNFGRKDAALGKEYTASVAGEVSYLSGDHEYGGRSGTLSQWTFQAGPRLMWNGPAGHRIQPYVVGLAGFTIEQKFRDKTSLALAGGFGVDLRLAPKHRLVLRVQQTWNWLDNGTSDNTYGQTGFALVWRFED